MADFSIERGRKSEYDEMIDFADTVFLARFTETVPSLYDGHPETAEHHYLLRENGRLRAMLISWPVTLHLGRETLSTRCIGTVSVHPKARGKGYMRALMARAIADAKADGTDLLFLGGQRQRYGYYGFEECGMRFELGFGPGEARRLPERRGIAAVPLTEALIAPAQALYEQQPIHAGRTDFLGNLRNEFGRPGALLRGDEFVGYFSEDGVRVREFYVRSPGDALAAALCVVDSVGKDLLFRLPPDQRDTARILSAACDKSSLRAQGMYLILHHSRAAKAALSLAADLGYVEDGRIVCAVEGGERFALEVRGGAVSVYPTEDTPHLSLPGREMTRALFSPLGSLLAGAPMPGWLPLPLCVPMQDEV